VKQINVASIESARLTRMSGERWLAIGDAAASFDPLSSYGLSSALEQAMDAAELLCLDGHDAALADFELRRCKLYDNYTAHRIAFYKSVRRYSGHAFWEHRIASDEHWSRPSNLSDRRL
jgi:2-polyprenyl-6-methoxyphenol hydroxylase-like FAD-dependent oxidoreductase